MQKKLVSLLALVMLTFCLTGCRQESATHTGAVSLTADTLSSIRASADAIRTSLAQEALTQTDMNQKSQELRALWDEALALLLKDAEGTLPRAELEKLTAEQQAWETDMAAALDAAGKAYEGGSLYPLIVNSEAARLTEERVLQLYELLK